MAHPRVFISCYKGDPDTQFTQRLLADLSASGAIVATSSGNNETAQRLTQALKHCQWLILVQTPAALASPQVRNEVDTAFSLVAQGKMRGVLVVIAAPTDPRAMPPSWANARMFDAMQNYQQALLSLQTALELHRADSGATILAASGAPLAQGGQYAAPAQGAAGSPWSTPPAQTPFQAVALPPLYNAPGQSQPSARAAPHPLRTILITALVVVLLLAAAGGFFLAKNAIITYNASALSSAVRATTTAQAQITADAAIVSRVNPYPPGSGPLTISNALTNTSSLGFWQTNSACTIKNSAYDVSEAAATGFTYCYDQSTNFNDFVYQAQVKIISGYAAGLVFRADTTSKKPELYYFLISENGSYGFYLVTDHLNTVGNEIQGGTNTNIIRTGLGQTNVIAVVARGHYLDFYVNLHYLFSAADDTISSGQIGVCVYDRSNAAEAAFSYIKVWQLG
jgi:hypothetical protein